MGTAAFVAYLMSVCEPRFAATQYALLSALLALTRAVVGPIAGSLTEQFGYAAFFLFTFLLSLPGFALLPFLSRAAPPEDASARLLAEPAPHCRLHQPLAVPGHQHGAAARDLTDQPRMTEQHDEVAPRHQFLQRGT